MSKIGDDTGTKSEEPWGSGTKNVVIWCTENFKELFDYLTEEYNKIAGPYVKFNVEYFSNSIDLHSSILMDSSLSRLPNIVFTEDIGAVLRLIPDLLMPFDDYVDRSIFTSDGAISSCCIEGQLYALPVASYIAAFYYNIDDFEQCGIHRFESLSIEEFMDYAKRLKDETGKYIIAYYDELARIFMLSTGQLFYDGSGNLVADNVQEWFEFLDALRESGVICCDANTIDDYMYLLANGSVCGVIGGYYWCKNIKQIVEDDKLEQYWAVSKIPQRSPFVYNVSLSDAGCMIIKKDDEEICEKLVDLLKWAFISNYESTWRMAWNGWVSVTPIPAGSFEGLNNGCFVQNVPEFLASLLKDIPAIEYGEYTQQATQLIENLSKEVVTGQTTAEDAYDTFYGYASSGGGDYIGGSGGSGGGGDLQPVKLESIEVSNPPQKLEYFEDELFSPAGMKVVGHYSNNTTRVINGYSWYPTTFKYIGEQVVTIVYNYDGKEYRTTQKVNVVKRKIVGISATPVFNYYYKGSTLKNSDFTVLLEYNDGSAKRIDNFEITNPKLESAGEYYVNIEYIDDGKKYTCTAKIMVHDKLVAIYIKSRPNKLMYSNGDRFNNTGMIVNAVYWDGFEETIPNGQLIATPDIIKFGDGKTSAIVMIAYTENGVKIETGLSVYKKTGAEIDDCDMTQDFGGCGTGSVNMSSGRLTYRFTDFACSDATFPITISRVYDMDADNCGAGKGWRLNLQQELVEKNGQWKYIDKNGKEHIFAGGFSTDDGRSAIRNETLGLDLFNDRNKIRLVDRNNNTLLFKIIKGVYRLVAVHQYPSTPDKPIGAYSMDIAYDVSTGYIYNVAAGREIGGKRRTVQFNYTNGLLTGLTYNFANSTVVAEYEYSGNNLISIKKCNGNVIINYSAITKFHKTDSSFIVEDLSSKDRADNCKSLIYSFDDNARVSAISVGYGESDRETTNVNYTGIIKSSDKENPVTNIVASCYTEYNGTLSVTSFNSLCAAASYSYEKCEDGTYDKPKKVNSAVSCGFDYMSLADNYSDTLDIFHDDFESNACNWSGGYLTTGRCISGTKSLESYSKLRKSYTFHTDKNDGETLYLSMWANSSGRITVTVKIDGARGSGEFTHKLDSGLMNLWQFTAFCLGRVCNDETITIEVAGNDVLFLDDVRLTKAPYETPDDMPESEYNAFGNIKKEYAYSPVDGKVTCTEYKYNAAHQLTERIVTVNGAPHSRAVYDYNNDGLLVRTKAYGTGNNYFEEAYAYTDYVQSKTIDINDNITEYSEGMDWVQTVARSDESNSPSVTVKNTYYTDSNAVKQVSSNEYINKLTYNATGALTSAQYGNSQSSGSQSQISFEYDSFGNMSKALIGTTDLVSLEYDYKHLNKVTYANGGSVEYTYDSKNRITAINEGDEYAAEISYSDNADDAVTVTDTNGLKYQSRTINKDGKTSEYTASFDGYDRTILKVVGLALNGAGNISTTEIYTDNTATPFERTKTVVDRNGQIIELKRELNGASSTYEYDELYRLKSKSTTLAPAKFKTEYEYCTGIDDNWDYSRLLSEKLFVRNVQQDEFHYFYYKSGNISTINLNGKSYAVFEYDNYGRIISESNRYFQELYYYKYDVNGNLLSKTVYDMSSSATGIIRTLKYDYSSVTDGCGQNAAWGNQLKKYNGKVIKYDEYGNPTDYLGKRMTWNGRRLVDIDGTDMEYDYNGLRVQKGTTRYFWQGNSLRMERDSTRNHPIYFYYDESGVCGIECNGSDYYFQKNMLGDVCAIYNALGELVCRYVYDAWGNHKIYDKDGNEIEDNYNSVGSQNPIRYRGYYWDREFKLYYLKSRYYDPEVGRFISPDSIEYLDPASISGMNLYAYCGNNPVMNVDNGGNSWSSFWNDVGNWFLDTGLKILACTTSVAEIIGGVALTAVGAGTIGGGLVTAGITSLIGGFVNEANGGSFIGGWVEGSISGIVSYAFSTISMPTGLWHVASSFGSGLGSFLGTAARTAIDNKLLGRNDNVWFNATLNGEIAACSSLLLGGLFRFIVGVNYSDIVNSTLTKAMVTAIDNFYNWAASFIGRYLGV
ncbi:MAG: hypothetical protein K2O04_02525 [Clostridiales bacterium]|nr:hypothetical protein [Clostridiales bacterium]